ncbi:MAG: hypothetical protein JRI22_18335 [Deltaproteobacteria bacterium]|nr:hypothetical protein [Deltaproteobacteria bacterium]
MQRQAQLREFFIRTLRSSFPGLGIRDMGMIQYVAEVLTEFARTDLLYRIRSARGERLEHITGMLMEVRDAQEDTSLSIVRKREIRQHIGDYALFMLGIFREYLERIGITELYMMEGRTSYHRVWEWDRSLYRPGAQRFRELSLRFPEYAGALDFVKRTRFAMTSPEKDPFDRFMEQLERWAEQSDS